MNELKHVEGRIIVKVDVEQKNFYTFQNGQTIRIERDYNNLDRSYTQQILGICVDGKEVPKNAFVLFHFNSLHPSYQIYNHSTLSGEEIASGIKMFSIPEEQVYLWKMPGEKEWNPCNGFAIAERVFRKYEGILLGIEPKKIPNCLYVKTGELKGKVVRTLHACDAKLVFRNELGVDETIIRFRPFGNKATHRLPEAIAIDEELTDGVKNGKILIGITIKDARSISDIVPI